MKVYITKHALSTGIRVAEVERSEDTPSMVREKGKHGFVQYFHGKDWTFVGPGAIRDAESRRVKKILSLRKQIEKLERLTFKLPE